MSTIPLGPTPAARARSAWAPWALGFRPFFLAAGLSAVVLMALWLPMWLGRLPTPAYYGPVGWHAHEMLFGYAVAVVAGFLLTAVRNWTGIATPSGAPLAGLVALWLAGRVLPWAYPALPAMLVAAVDWLFLPALAAALARPLWRGANRTNRVFLPLLGAMALANLLVHLASLGLAHTAWRGTHAMVTLVALLVALVGGRVMPFFTEKAVAGAQPRSHQALERGSLWALAVLAAAQALLGDSPWTAPLAALVAATQALRLAGWHHPGVWRIPLLWVLYTGFGWLVAGFALQALGGLGLFPPNLALHAVTVGGIGVLTLGMMARVALGHTGRDLRPTRVTSVAFVLLNLGAAVRVLGPLVPGSYNTAIQLAGGLWLLAFLAFTTVYAPILLRARVDGRPG